MITTTALRVTEILTAVGAGSPPLDAMPQRLVDACAVALQMTGVGMVLTTDAGPAGTVAATRGAAYAMEAVQFTLGEGPCVDASRSGRPVLLPDLATSGTQRWPGFARAALDAGIRAAFALPLRVGAIRLGVLGLYRDTPGALTTRDVTESLSFADAATTVLLHLQAQGPGDEIGGALMHVLEDYTEVHQATGMISVHADVTLAQACCSARAHSLPVNRSRPWHVPSCPGQCASRATRRAQPMQTDRDTPCRAPARGDEQPAHPTPQQGARP